MASSNFKRRVSVGFAALLLAAAAVQAESPEEKGLAIAVEAERRDTGYVDSSSEMTMTLRTAQGRETVRKMRIRFLEQQNDGDRGITVFDEPRDVRGISLLTWTHKQGSDDQWMYFPARKRTRRINSDNKSGPFMGSEFAYEDMGSQEVEKYSYKYLRDDTLNGQAVFVTERYPNDKDSGYTKQVLYTDQEHYRVLKVEYYDRKKSHLKTLTFSGYKQYLNKYWRPHKLHMVNHQTKKETLLEVANIQFQTGLKPRDFESSRLKLAR